MRKTPLRKPPLGRVAANNKTRNTYAANLKQFYGLRKDINALQISVDRLCSHITKTLRGHA